MGGDTMRREYDGEVTPCGGVTMGKGHHGGVGGICIGKGHREEGTSWGRVTMRSGHTYGSDAMRRGHHGEGTSWGGDTHRKGTLWEGDPMGKGHHGEGMHIER